MFRRTGSLVVLKVVPEVVEGGLIGDKSLYVFLRELVYHDIAEKVDGENVIADPIPRKAILKL
ncbi:hypothetical protein JCM16161A_20540 [Vulcanisaeta sp. JCM 16161]|uniref:hypothetical protein n=1 Tax=Vulcanisaeta sp. JCM 16161 TaxID=1295372 RepID=UPI0006CFCF82|nr:hypothetical protein [Vulcanisaeta sp. JCM 16161]